MSWRPGFPGEVPTLGHYVLDWMVDNLAMPDRADYEPFVPTREQAQFILNFYALDPKTCKRRRRRAVYSRPKGAGKSPLLAAIACVEALADVVPDGWDRDGRPVGKPWRSLRTVYAQLAAVAESQTGNAWDPLLEMLREGPVLDNYPGLDPLETFVNLPTKGKIEYITSGAASKEGNKPIFVVLDQTESWLPSNGGIRMANTIRRNLGKTGGSSIEAPNAFEPGEGSVAEMSAQYWSMILEGKAKNEGLLYDHIEAPPDTDMTEREPLKAGLKVAYGDSDWVDLDRIVDEIWDPATTPQDARRFYLNQITQAADSWLSAVELRAILDADKIILPGDAVVLGFDGSRGRTRGKADATALIGCRVYDGHLFQVAVWEQPDGPEGREWLPPVLEVDAEVRTCFDWMNVVGFYADPSGWDAQVAAWENKYGRKLKLRASQSRQIAHWPRGKDSKVVEYVKALETSIRAGEATYDGSGALTRHMLNARRRHTRSGMLLFKKFPESPDKIDAAYASVIAWKARSDALAKGLNKADARGTAGGNRRGPRVLVLD